MSVKVLKISELIQHMESEVCARIRRSRCEVAMRLPRFESYNNLLLYIETYNVFTLAHLMPLPSQLVHANQSAKFVHQLTHARKIQTFGSRNMLLLHVVLCLPDSCVLLCARSTH